MSCVSVCRGRGREWDSQSHGLLTHGRRATIGLGQYLLVPSCILGRNLLAPAGLPL